MKINVHIKRATYAYDVRILKQVRSIEKAQIFDKIFIIGINDLTPHKSEIEIENAPNTKMLRWTNYNIKANKGIKLLQMLVWYYKVYRYCTRNKISCLNVHEVLLLPLALIIKWRTSAKLIYDTHELETECLGIKSYPNWMQKVIKKVESYAIKRCDATMVVNESIADWYQKAYPSITRPTVVMNVPEYVKPLNKKPDLIRQQLQINKETKIFLYQGIFLEGRGIKPVITAMKQADNLNACVVFLGYGELESYIKDCANQYSNVFYMPTVPLQQLPMVTASADFGMSLIENTCLSYFYCLPNKLFQYIMGSVPVLASNLVEIQSIVEANFVGVVVNPSDPKNIVAAMRDLIQQDYLKLQNQCLLTAKKYCWEQQENVMTTFYNNLFPQPQ